MLEDLAVGLEQVALEAVLAFLELGEGLQVGGVGWLFEGVG